jgi:hypothetical protein
VELGEEAGGVGVAGDASLEEGALLVGDERRLVDGGPVH